MLTDPQSWNRYAYVLNNPLGLVDPLGLEPKLNCMMDPESGNCVYVYRGVRYNVFDLIKLAFTPTAIVFPRPGDGGADIGDYFLILGNIGALNLVYQIDLMATARPGANGSPQTPQQTPRQQCIAEARDTFNKTMAEIKSRPIWRTVAGQAAFGTLTGAAWGCLHSPFARAMCVATRGGSALPAAIIGGIAGGASAAAYWYLEQTGATANAQKAFTQQVNNVCSKLPN